jgi:uncharacterized membrane protein required for colicin V production
MGLDLALGAIILLAAIRGWFKGFMNQAVRISSFVACFYLADPVRDQMRPYMQARLPAIDPAIIDRILWWGAAVVSYIVLVGLVSLALKLLRTPNQSGAADTRLDDRFGGVMLGAAKGLAVAAVLAAGVERYGHEVIQRTAWAGHQVEGSHALKWTEQYRPVPRFWSAPPVRRFVEHIQRNGLRTPSEGTAEKQVEERTATNDSSGFWPPRLDLFPAEDPAGSDEPSVLNLDPEIVQELEKLRQEFRAQKPQP